jgi:hypothetical protein
VVLLQEVAAHTLLELLVAVEEVHMDSRAEDWHTEEEATFPEPVRLHGVGERLVEAPAATSAHCNHCCASRQEAHSSRGFAYLPTSEP